MPERPRSGWTLAPPGPSSLTETWRSASAASSTETRAAGAYFATFVKPSETRKYAAAMTPSGMAGSRLGTKTSTFRGEEAARDRTAASSPRSESTLGWIPATVLLSARRALSASSCALPKSARTSPIFSGTTAPSAIAESKSKSASPTSIEAVTRYCCAPS